MCIHLLDKIFSHIAVKEAYLISNQSFYFVLFIWNRTTSVVMVSVITSSAEDLGFESRSGQTKDFEIGICCFSAKHAAIRRKSKDWLARDQNNVSEWSDTSTCGLLFQ